MNSTEFHRRLFDIGIAIDLSSWHNNTTFVSTCIFHGLASDKLPSFITLFTYAMLTCPLIYFCEICRCKNPWWCTCRSSTLVAEIYHCCIHVHVSVYWQRVWKMSTIKKLTDYLKLAIKIVLISIISSCIGRFVIENNHSWDSTMKK